MKKVAKLLAFVMVFIQFNSIIMHISYAENGTKNVSNGYIEFNVNEDNGRYTIATDRGATFRNDSNQPLLFEEYYPETSFTTFKIGNEDFIFGNNYGFLGVNSRFNQEPTTVGTENITKWEIKGVEITQILSLYDNEKNAGNVRVKYVVENKTNASVDLGARILLDTMLGANDGSPMITPGNQAFIEKETRLTGEDIPVYWKSVDQQFAPNIVSFGLLSGWRSEDPLNAQATYYNYKPDEMVIGHWEGLSKTKWDYTINPMLNFTSNNNKYGSKDSAVAIYWNQQALAVGESRVYETYYGLGEFSTVESNTPIGFRVMSPEKLELNDDKSGYSEDTVTIVGEIDNTLKDQQVLLNAKAKIEFYNNGLNLPYGVSETINIGNIPANTVKNFSWDLNASPLYAWTYFKYKVTLTAQNLEEPLVRDGDILIPSISGTPPEVKFTDFKPNNLYHMDQEKEMTILGQNLQGVTIGNNYQVVLENSETNQRVIIPQNELRVENTSINFDLPVEPMLTTTGNIQVSFQYIQGVDQIKHDFKSKLNISDDKKYMIRKYGILLVVREETNGEYAYKLVEAKNEETLRSLASNEKIILDIRAEEIVKSGDIYTIESEKATINSIITATVNEFVGGDPMTIEARAKDISHEDDYIFITGKARLEIPGFVFQNGPYEMTFVDGTMYSVTDEDDSEDVVLKKPVIYKGLPVIDELIILHALPVELNQAVIRESAITFGGSINIYSIIKGVSTLNEIENKNNNSQKDDKKEDKKDDEGSDIDLGVGLNIDDLRFGVSNGTVVLLGLKADGSVGIPNELTKKLVPECDLGAELEVAIDTFDNWSFEAKADINFEVIEASGEIGFKVYDAGGFPIPIPDKVMIYGGVEPGIPLIPPVPIGYLVGLGGGFEELFDTLTLNFNFLPPLKLTAMASLQLFKIFEADKLKLALSARGMEFSVDEIKIGPMDIFRDLGMYLKFKDDLQYPGFEMKTYAGLDISGWASGEAYFLAAVDSAKNGPLGPLTLIGEANGAVHVPENSPLFPGFVFGSVGFGISDEGVFGEMLILDSIPGMFSYYWGGNATVGLKAALESGLSKDALYTAVNIDEQGNKIGVVKFMENMSIVADSKNKYLMASTNKVEPILISNLTMDQHEFDLIDHAYTLIQLEFMNDLPSIQLYDPSGHEIQLIENQNYAYKNEPTNKTILISIVNPQNGQWKIVSDDPVDIKVVKVEEVKKIEQVTAQINGNQLVANWEVDQPTTETVTMVLVNDLTNDPGILISEGSLAANRTATVTLPDDLPTGDYYLRVQLKRQDGAILNTVETSSKNSYINPLQPLDISNLQVENIGNSLLNVMWDENDTVDGYVIDAIDVTSNESIASYEIVEKQQSNVIGGTFNEITIENNQEKSRKAGLLPNRTYEIAVYGYKIINDKKYYSGKVSKTITVLTPNPADISYSILSPKINKGIEEGIQQYLTSEGLLKLTLNSTQEVAWEVTHNNQTISSSTGSQMEKQIQLVSGENAVGIKVENAQGDISKESFNVIYDNEEPTLRIDSPAQGALIEDQIDIAGFVDLNSRLFVNGVEVTYDNDGLFNYQMQIGNEMSKSLKIEAYDEAGNKSEYYAEVYNDKIDDIVEIQIIPNTNQIEVGVKVDYDVQLVDQQGEVYLIGDELIEWSLLNNTGAMDITDNGEITSITVGKDVLIASYQIAENYAFEDAVVLEVVDELKTTQNIFASPDIINIKPNETYSLRIYENFMDQTNRELNSYLLDYTVISGNDVISIDKQGRITGLKVGTAIVSFAYSKNGQIYKVDVMVNVKTSTSSNSNSQSKEDKKILDILKGIVNQDGSGKILISGEDIERREGKVRYTLSENQINTAFGKAYKNEDGRKKVVLDIPKEEGSEKYELSLPKNVLSGDSKDQIQVDTEFGSIILNNDMLKGMLAVQVDDVVISIEKKKIDNDKIGHRPVVDVSLITDNIDMHWQNDNSAITISIAYKLLDGEKAEGVVVYYINEEGVLTKVSNGVYSTEKGEITFETNHLSLYGVGYEEGRFDDLVGYDWAGNEIEELANEGIINGIGNDQFGPHLNITRADFVLLLVRMLESDIQKSVAFDDVEANAYYYTEVMTARALGIIKGDDNNRFRPTEQITRQDMMVMIERAFDERKIFNDEAAIDISVFYDYSNIASYATDAVSKLVSNEIIKGYNNLINPTNNTTRAEAAVTLYRIYKKSHTQ